MGSLNSMGYGTIRLNKVYILAHRLFYAMHHGEPGELDVCHKCDNPPCCNPEHLFLGTRKDNMQDMSSKFRAKDQFTPTEIAKVYELADLGYDADSIALILNRSVSPVGKYLRNRKTEKEED